MMLRLLLIVAAIGLVLILLTPRKDAASLERRGRAMGIALRQTFYSVAAIGFALLMAFGLWHGLRHDDRTAMILAAVAAPLCLGFVWLAVRAERRTARR
jgi:cell division protein FtsW (lipid II flippase)